MIRDGIRRLFRLVAGPRSMTAREVDEEVREHLDRRIEQLVTSGLTPGEAEREARRKFGADGAGVRALHEAARVRDRDVRLRDRLDALVLDARYAVRGVVREPSFSAFIIVTLALGIGANAAMYGVVDRLLVRGPEHVQDADRLVRLYTNAVTPWAGERTWASAGYVSYASVRDEASSFSHVGAYAINEGTIGRRAEARPIQVGWATADFFPTVGVQPAAGRFFNAVEDAPAAPQRVAVIGYAMWQQDYGGGPIDGRTVVLNGEDFDIVGVAPRGFTGVGLTRVDVWGPMSYRSRGTSRNWERTWNAQWLRVIGRLKPGVTAEQASDDATRVRRASYTGTQAWERDARVLALPIGYTPAGTEPAEARVTRWLVGVAVVVLLIACANTANLLLARAVRRRREFAVRAALGSGRGRLVRLVLTEGMVLAVLAGATGVGVAGMIGFLVRGVLLPDIEWTASAVGWRVMAALAAVALVTGLLSALLPALHASGRSLSIALKTGVRDGGGRRALVRSLLTASQAAMSVVLLVGAGLFVRSLWSIRAKDLGIEPEKVIVAYVPLPNDGPPQGETFAERLARRRAVELAVLDTIRTLPGVERASLAVGLAYNSSFSVGLRVPPYDSIPTLPGGGPYIHAVASDYFETMGLPIIAGRGFTTSDRDGSEPVVIVSDLMARTLWPAGSALGQCMMIGDAQPAPCSRVVGVAANANRDGLREAPAMMYYIPFGQERDIGGTALLVRPSGPPAAMFAPLRQAIRAMNPEANYIRAAVLQESLDAQISPWRLGATMFTMCGVLALLVAAVGMYSVLSYVVAQRRHEFAVRAALGAQPADIARHIIGGGVGLATIGVAAGLALAWLGGVWVEPLLFETNARDPVVFAGVAGLLLGVSLLASVGPALRARAVAPATALRAE